MLCTPLGGLQAAITRRRAPHVVYKLPPKRFKEFLTLYKYLRPVMLQARAVAGAKLSRSTLSAACCENVELGVAGQGLKSSDVGGNYSANQ